MGAWGGWGSSGTGGDADEAFTRGTVPTGQLGRGVTGLLLSPPEVAGLSAKLGWLHQSRVPVLEEERDGGSVRAL